MIYIFASVTYQQVIMESCRETEQLIEGNECKEELYILPMIKENYQVFSGLDAVIVDITGVKDSDKDIDEAMNMLRITNSNCRIIILAPNRQPGDALLAKCFQNAIYDIITTEDFAEIKEQLSYSLQHGRNYKESVIYKDEIDYASIKTAQKKVDHVRIGVLGTQRRIGTTHMAIMIANYLRKKGYLVCYLESNSTGVLDDIVKNYEMKWRQHLFFNLSGIDYYRLESESINKINSKAYNFVIIDYGCCDAPEDLKEFSACDRNVVVSGVKAWEQDHIQKLFDRSDYESLKKYYYYFNFCPKEQRFDVINGMGELEHVGFMEYSEDPFEGALALGSEEIFEEYFPKIDDGKRKRR